MKLEVRRNWEERDNGTKKKLPDFTVWMYGTTEQLDKMESLMEDWQDCNAQVREHENDSKGIFTDFYVVDELDLKDFKDDFKN